MATANAGASSVSVLLSNGDGTFQAPAVYSLGSNLDPTFITSVDVNGDNKPDLVVVDNVSPGFVSVLLNNGNGTFGTPTNYAVGANPDGVAVIDLNGDNKPDLVVTNNGSSTMSVLLNQGNGTFGTQTSIALPGEPRSITAGDFSGDGTNDVAIVANGLAYVYTGTGTGGFGATPAQYNAGGGPGFIEAADLRGNHQLDLVVVNLFPSSDGIAVLLNNGDGTFANPVQYPLGPSVGQVGGLTSNLLAIGDVSGDGKPDLVVANGLNFGTNDVSVLLGNGDGTFGPVTTWVAGEGPCGVTIGDFTGDGTADLAVVNQRSEDISLLQGQGEGAFLAPLVYDTGTTTGPVVTGDFNGDGKQDIIVGSRSGTILAEIDGHGDGTFAAPITISNNVINPSVGTTRALAVADLNGDGKLDLVMLDTNNNVDVFMGNGDGTFQAPVVYSPGLDPASSQMSMAIGDFNGDGKPDIVIINAVPGSTTDGTATILMNNGDGTFAVEDQTPDIGARPTAVTTADVNGDGKADLIVTNDAGASSFVNILISNGDGTFESRVSYSVDGTPTAVAAAPLRPGDKPDLAVTSNFFGEKVDVLLNNGDGTFGASTAYQVGPNPTAVLIGDVTRDGIPDLVTTNQGVDSLTVWQGVGNGTFTSPESIPTADTPENSAFADFNGDGFLDIVTANSQGASVALTPLPASTTTIASGTSATFSPTSQIVSLSATITSNGIPVNEGTETFTILAGATPVGSPVTAAVSSGAATVNYTLPAGSPAGDYTIEAVYNGSSDFSGSTDTGHSLIVSPAATTTMAANASAPFSAADQVISLDASVTSPAGTVDEGTETFTILRGETAIGSPVTVSIANGTASANYTLPGGTPAGSYTIQAVYNDTANFSTASDSSHLLAIAKANATTNAASSVVSFSTSNQPIDVSATITSPAGTVEEGTETFTILQGETTIGSPVTVNVVNGAAAATYTLPGGTPVGSFTIQAVYISAGNYDGATDASHSLVINAAPSTTSPTDASSIISGSSEIVTLTGAVTSGGGAVNGGAFTFTIAGLGSVNSSAVINGSAGASFTIPANTPAGNYSITTAYSGTGNFAASSNSIGSLTINPFGAATRVVITNQPPAALTAGTTFGLTATIEDAGGHVVTTFNGSIMADLATNPGSLGGTTTVTAVNGVVTLSNLTVNSSGIGLRLQLTSTGLTSAASASFNIILASNILPVFVAPQIYGPQPNASQQQAYVKGIYRTLLGRDADTAGLNFWVASLNGGTAHSVLVNAFWNSPENRGREVDAYYQAYLGRKADPGGRAYWITQLQNGADETAIVLSFLLSAEELQASNTSFVQRLYQGALGRTAGTTDLNYWVGQLTSGATRQQVANSFVFSQEAAGVAVDSFYGAYLQRAADAASRTFWIDQISSQKATYASIAIDLLASDEFFANAAKFVP